jgi:hypothetical protein
LVGLWLAGGWLGGGLWLVDWLIYAGILLCFKNEQKWKSSPKTNIRLRDLYYVMFTQCTTTCFVIALLTKM